MTLVQLQQFQAVCRCGSVTKAAKSLHLTQPTVSASIRELERALGVELFNRIDGLLHLTSEGSFFLEHAYALLVQVQDLY